MDVAAWSLEIAKIVGPAGAVLLLWLLMKRSPPPVPVSLSQEPPPGVDRMIDLLTEIRDAGRETRDAVRDGQHQRTAMQVQLDRMERRQSDVKRALHATPVAGFPPIKGRGDGG